MVRIVILIPLCQENVISEIYTLLLNVTIWATWILIFIVVVVKFRFRWVLFCIYVVITSNILTSIILIFIFIIVLIVIFVLFIVDLITFFWIGRWFHRIILNNLLYNNLLDNLNRLVQNRLFLCCHFHVRHSLRLRVLDYWFLFGQARLFCLFQFILLLLNVIKHDEKYVYRAVK